MPFSAETVVTDRGYTQIWASMARSFNGSALLSKLSPGVNDLVDLLAFFNDPHTKVVNLALPITNTVSVQNDLHP